MVDHSITSVSRLTGLSASTLRTWERRYGAPVPMRAANGRRYYPEAEVERLQLISFLIQAGHSISDLCALSLSQLRKAKHSTPLNTAKAQAKDEIMRAIDAADLIAVRRVISQSFSRFSMLEVVEEILSPTLVSLGEGWVKGRYSPGLEHAVSAVIKQTVHAAASTYGWTRTAKPILFTTIEGERHELGLLLGWLLALTESANAVHLGPELSPSLIVDIAGLLHPDLVVLSFVHGSDEKAIRKALLYLDKHMPRDIEVWICAAERHPAFAVTAPPRYRRISSYAEFHRRLLLRERA